MIFSKVHSAEAGNLLARLLGREPEAFAASLNRLRLIAPYESFTLPKGGGRTRAIESPDPELKALQRDILEHLLYRVAIAPDCHGFVPGRSIVSHARLHRNQRSLLNHDLADAFPSCSRQRVRAALARCLGSFLKHGAPRAERRVRDELLELLSDLVTWRDQLPQGAPTSGALLNFCLAPLDRRLRKECRRWRKLGHALVYSRYADDLTLSARGELPPDADATMRRAIHAAGFRFNARKVHRADRARGQPLVVCGIHVDGEQLRLPRRRLKRYRAVLHRALCSPALSPEQRGEVAGIAGLVGMVYGTWPPALDQPWRLLQARHGLELGDGPERQGMGGYG